MKDRQYFIQMLDTDTGEIVAMTRHRFYSSSDFSKYVTTWLGSFKRGLLYGRSLTLMISVGEMDGSFQNIPF